MMMDDKDLDKMLNAYRVPVLDPDVVTQAVHNAIHHPVEMPQRKRGFRFMTSPFPAFMAGGAVAIAAMVLVILPLTGLQIRPALNIDAVVNELAASQQVAENDIKSADEILGLIDSRQDDEAPTMDEILNDQGEDDPIWDTFMGRS
jgi:hypothetical protein